MLLTAIQMRKLENASLMTALIWLPISTEPVEHAVNSPLLMKTKLNASVRPVKKEKFFLKTEPATPAVNTLTQTLQLELALLTFATTQLNTLPSKVFAVSAKTIPTLIQPPSSRAAPLMFAFLILKSNLLTVLALLAVTTSIPMLLKDLASSISATTLLRSNSLMVPVEFVKTTLSQMLLTESAKLRNANLDRSSYLMELAKTAVTTLTQTLLLDPALLTHVMSLPIFSRLTEPARPVKITPDQMVIRDNASVILATSRETSRRLMELAKLALLTNIQMS